MIGPSREERNTMRLAALLLACCTGLALANLPREDLPAGWLFAFVLPGAVLAWLGRFPFGPWQRAVLAIVLQTAACFLALHFVGPMSRPAALACTILPPLGFATVRCQPADQALALFLGFCVLLVGSILDGVHAPRIAAFCVTGCLALRCANRLTVLAAGRLAPASLTSGEPGSRRVLGGGVPLAIGCLLAVLAVERTLAWLPSPSRRGAGGEPSAATTNAPRRIGLDDSFELDGSRGLLSELVGERLVRAGDPTGNGLPGDLYLRSGFFAVAGLDRWRLGALDLSPSSARDGHVLRRPWPALDLRRAVIERFPGARAFVLVPPHTCSITRCPDLVVDPRREWLRQEPPSAGSYEVTWQDPLPLAADEPLEPRARALGLLDLPPGLDRARWDELLDSWRVGDGAGAALEAIAAGLQRHCRYERSEPTGPFASALENFLFATGDRHGYCMHFAAAAATMLRLRGVPCRIGVGLYGGERMQDGTRLFGSNHAHAWVEVPFVRHGWRVFDPTPPVERGRRPTPSLDLGPEGPDDPHLGAFDEAVDPLERARELLAEPWLLAALLTLALAVTSMPRRRGARRSRAGVEAPPASRSARRLLAQLLAALAAAGHARRRGQTLEVFAHELERSGRFLPPLRAAFATYQEVRFGERPFDAERERTLRDALAAARTLAPVREPASSPQPRRAGR